MITDLTDSSETKRGTRSPPDEHHHAFLRNATHKAKAAVTTKKAAFASSLKRGRKLLSLQLSATFTPYGMYMVSVSMMRNVSRNVISASALGECLMKPDASFLYRQLLLL